MSEFDQDDRVDAGNLFKQHSRFVAHVLRRLGVQSDEIDDAVQEVFLTVHQRKGYRPGDAKPTSYLIVIATHVAARQRRRMRTLAARRTLKAVEDIESPTADPARILATRDDLRTLHLALSKLDPALRTTLLLADGEGESCVSIAAVMNVPLGTVYWRLSEARRRLAIALTSV